MMYLEGFPYREGDGEDVDYLSSLFSDDEDFIDVRSEIESMEVDLAGCLEEETASQTA
jgi:hypothetical protein